MKSLLIKLANLSKYQRKYLINDWEIRAHLVACHYRRYLIEWTHLYWKYLISSWLTYYFLCGACWWISLVAKLQFFVLLKRWCEINRRDTSINYLSCSFVLNDRIVHDHGMVYRNKELEAPSYSNTYYQTS